MEFDQCWTDDGAWEINNEDPEPEHTFQQSETLADVLWPHIGEAKTPTLMYRGAMYLD
jgi:hypothetical protein